MKAPLQQRFAGFSATELLVLMVIIAVLVVLSTAGISSVKRTALTARCVTHLKTLGSAFHQFITDHEGRFPPTPNYIYTDSKGERKQGVTANSLAPYLNGDLHAPVWLCPADTKRPTKQAYRWSYGQNRPLGWAEGAELPFDPRYNLLRGVEKPLSRVIYLMDYVSISRLPATDALNASIWPLKGGSTRTAPLDRRVDFERHGTVANALFLDGSVRGLRYEDLEHTGNQFLSPLP